MEDPFKGYIDCYYCGSYVYSSDIIRANIEGKLRFICSSCNKEHNFKTNGSEDEYFEELPYLE